MSQIQDIAGCRLVVPNIVEQERVVEWVSRLFADAVIVDRRQNPSHGYRAVHLIVRHSGKLVEIQVRTLLQHVWAELSEKLSDVIHPAIKYGSGDETMVRLLLEAAKVIAHEEIQEVELNGLEKAVSAAIASKSYPEDKRVEILALEADIRRTKSQQLLQREEGLRTLSQIVEELRN